MTQIKYKHDHLWHWFETTMEKHAEKSAYQSFNHRISYSELKNKTLQLMGYLQHLNVQPGDRIAVMLPNCIQQPISSFAILGCNGIVVNVNPLYTAAELKHQLVDSGATIIIVLANMAHLIEKIRHDTQLKHIIITYIGDELPWYKSILLHIIIKYIRRNIPNFSLEHHSWKTCMKTHFPFNKPTFSRNSIAILQYTGGTTGVAKGVKLTHKNILTNLQQVQTVLPPQLYHQGKSTILTALPLYHIFALLVSWVTLQHGGMNLLIANPRDINGLIKVLKKNKIHGIPILQTLMEKILQHKTTRSIDFSNLVATITGGMATHKRTAIAWQRITGCIVQQGYGLSETSPVVSLSQHQDTYATHVGHPLPMTQIKIVDTSMKSCPPNTIGEILVKGPQVMSGYWKDQEETKKVLHQGWFSTGDLGLFDLDGNLVIKDRLKDMIIISGFNVYPSEIEEALCLHPNIIESCVVGKKKNTHELLIAYYTSKNKLDSNQLKHHCKQYLTGYKIPAQFKRIKEIPKSILGKSLRKDLKEKSSNKK